MPRSKRDFLRELSRKFPGPPEFWRILRTLPTQNDRSAALLGVAFMEASLERLMIKKLPRMTAKLESRLFKNRGPLSDFDSKILVATAAGIIPDYAADLFNSMRAVRNVFAHSMIDVSFGTKEISDEIERYILPFTLKSIKWLSQDDDEQPGDDRKPPDSKTAFCISTLLLVCMIDDLDEEFNINEVFSAITFS